MPMCKWLLVTENKVVTYVTICQQNNDEREHIPNSTSAVIKKTTKFPYIFSDFRLAPKQEAGRGSWYSHLPEGGVSIHTQSANTKVHML